MFTSPCLNLFSCHVLEKSVSLIELNIKPKLEMRDTKGRWSSMIPDLRSVKGRTLDEYFVLETP